jgi:hypothetical protein
MAMELVIRFIAGGLVVSAFAVIGDVLRPKPFAGIFGAAPSVALATLGLTFMTKGGSVAGIEGRSMIAGAAALFAYSLLSGMTLLQRRGNALAIAGTAGIAWFVVAFALWGAVLR